MTMRVTMINTPAGVLKMAFPSGGGVEATPAPGTVVVDAPPLPSVVVSRM